MNINEELKRQNLSRHAKLEPNVYVSVIQSYIALLRASWQPKTKEITDRDGELMTIHYDEYNDVWTTEDIAFKGHVFKKVSQIIKK
ncbi:hypothetical protein HP439_13030 [Sphingobacterium shayense]|uniref:hypothetical protein n=1 Tax=Sphingobacterium shayense TaxID=626343 RepID=UPI0015522FF1|nr:hypothetical protein [Sphingobacterium shayense]NQD71646.1 hypothetical protein [Sphingobacterium shayense]